MTESKTKPLVFPADVLVHFQLRNLFNQKDLVKMLEFLMDNINFGQENGLESLLKAQNCF